MFKESIKWIPRVVARVAVAGVLAAMLAGTPGRAAVVEFLGQDVKTDANWRTPTTIKAMDSDGDNIYGSDGYVLFNWTGANWAWEPRNPAADLRVLPSYIESVTDDFTFQYRNDSVYGHMNDPAEPATAHVGTLASGAIWGFNTITIQRKGATPAFNLTVFTAYDLYAQQVWVHSGNPADAVRGDLTVAAGKTRYVVFRIGAGNEDVVVRVYSQGNNVSGVGFDSNPPPPQVIENFTRTPAGNWGEALEVDKGVMVGQPVATEDQPYSAPRALEFSFNTGPTTATAGLVKVMTLVSPVVGGLNTLSWQCRAPRGFAYRLEIGRAGTWITHATPRFTQTMDNQWQRVEMNTALLTPLIAPGMELEHIYIRVYGLAEGGYLGLTGRAYFDDFVFKTRNLSGTFPADAQMLGIHKGLPFKNP